MNRVVHFEIYTDDPEAVRPFYEAVFGWKIEKWDGGPVEYWTVKTARNQRRAVTTAGRTTSRNTEHGGGGID
jgi:predicted enzyme related to lactoylglutathione lyase